MDPIQITVTLPHIQNYYYMIGNECRCCTTREGLACMWLFRKEVFDCGEFIYHVWMPPCVQQFGLTGTGVIQYMVDYLIEHFGVDIIKETEVDELFRKFLGFSSERKLKIKKSLPVVHGIGNNFTKRRFIRGDVINAIKRARKIPLALDPDLIRCSQCERYYDKSLVMSRRTLVIKGSPVYGVEGRDIVILDTIDVQFCSDECYGNWWSRDANGLDRALSTIEDNKCGLRKTAKLKRLLTDLRRSLQNHDLPALMLLQEELQRLENSPS